MNKYHFSFLLITTILLPSICFAQNDSPFITPKQAVNLATATRQKVQNLTTKSSKAELAGLNKSINRIHKVQSKILGDKAASISKEILNAKDTPQEVENKINAIFQNNAQPEDFIHLMEPPLLEEEKEQDIEKTATLDNKETPQTEEKTSPTSGNTKEIIVEEDDDTTKHIFRRKVFTKQ